MSTKATVACLALLLSVCASAQPEQPALMRPVPAAAASAPAVRLPELLLPQLTDQVIRDAVRATLAEPADNPRRYEADTIRGNSYSEFSQQFSEARVPDCLHSDGLKRQPTFFLQGLLALPFIVVAKVRGKCN